MVEFRSFRLLDTPLVGTNLIEASAGTGKTHAIAGLFLRLLLEKNLSVNEILVVTFTEAATEELRDRIRTTIREAVDVFSRRTSGSEFLENLAERQTDPAGATNRLREALRDFDRAGVFTIHGFCRRVLHENAFESGSLFDTEFLADENEIKREIVEDFWRRHIYEATPLFVNYAMRHKFTPSDLLSLVGSRAGQPDLEIIPDIGILDTSHQERAFQSWAEKVRRVWPTVRTEVEDILRNHDGLNLAKYRVGKIRDLISAMDGYASAGAHEPELFASFHRFTSSELQGVAGAHRFFRLCDALAAKKEALEEVFKKRLLGLGRELFRYANKELTRRKNERNVQAFDDLLINLRRVLEGPGGETLAKSIRMKFKAALIDEFQDTDPIQYAIFRRVFEHGHSIVFLIGDPKQAIYGFRGADLFTYMDASREVASRYTLPENWRSEPGLITAVNTLFGHVKYPFVYEDIQFPPVSPAPCGDREMLTIEGDPESPLLLFFLRANALGNGRKAVSKALARERIRKSVAAEILRLLRLGREHRAFLGAEPLDERDIAVLVRRNQEARQVQKDLSALGIPSVVWSTMNLFDSREASEMERILAAMVEPRNERRLRSALATDMVGVHGEALEDCPENRPALEAWFGEFKRCHDLWKERGFIPMFREFMSRKECLPRLGAFPDGERRITNVLHLVEIVQHISTDKKMGMTGLLKWLSEQRDPNAPRLEEHQLRLESDENAVKVVTTHKSKGLQYPIVFCPFFWDGSKMRRSDAPFTFHDEGNQMRLTLDLGSERRAANRDLAEKESLAENLRLLYVALTRAKNRCYLVWGRINEAETSAPAYLLHQCPAEGLESTIHDTAARFKRLCDEDVLRELETVAARARGKIALREMDRPHENAYSVPPRSPGKLIRRTFSGEIDRTWRISSFSSLVRGRPHGAELADRDAFGPRDGADHGEAERPGGEGASMFTFPKGIRAGTLLHEIFECLDFTRPDAPLMGNLVQDRLQAHGFSLTWDAPLCAMIHRVLKLPLEPDRGDFTLSRIQNTERLNELEFYFPLRRISPRLWGDLFARCTGIDVPELFLEFEERLTFSPVRGVMKGFMDMVFRFGDRFYLVDWKSNWLGDRVRDYGPDRLARVMGEEFYWLQYHLYTVALDQYFRLRIPGYDYERHFGGVYYIFLRGVDPAMGPDFGIYRDRPPAGLIEILSQHLVERN